MVCHHNAIIRVRVSVPKEWPRSATTNIDRAVDIEGLKKIHQAGTIDVSNAEHFGKTAGSHGILILFETHGDPCSTLSIPSYSHINFYTPFDVLMFKKHKASA
jgi:hypothetical protein